MALTKTTVTWAPVDGQGRPLADASVTFAPTSDLSATTGEHVSSEPFTLRAPISADLISTDNEGVTPALWGWQVIVTIGARSALSVVSVPSSPSPVSLDDLLPAITGGGGGGGGGSPGGAVDSVNGQTGDVVLTAADVGADAAGAAAAAQSAAEAYAAGQASGAQGTAETFATAAVATETTRAGAAEALLAPLASPALTGSPTAPTPAPLTSSTAIATTAYADSAVSTETTRAEGAEALALAKSASLSDVASVPAARTSLGLGSAALQASSAFDASGAAASEASRALAAEALLVPASAIPDTSALYPGAANMPGPLQPSHVITDFQSGHGWTSSGSGTFALNDTTSGNFISGTQAATAATGGAGAQCDVRKFAGTSYDTTGQLIRLRFRFDSITHLSELDFYAGSSSLANCWKWSVYVPGLSAYITSGDWITLTLLFSDATVTGSPSRTAVTDWQFQTWDDSAGTVSAHYQSVELVPDGTAVFPGGVVSVCFDDSYSTPRDNGAWSALDAAGYPATLFTITDRLGLSGYISLADIQARTDRYGWESAGHAYTDADHSVTDTGLTAAALDADARAQRAWLLASGVRGGDGYAYPLGNFGLTSDGGSVIGILRRYYSWNRTTSSRMHETWPPADRYRLRAISGISTFSGGVTPSAVETQVTSVAAGGGWLILVFHKIVTGAPAATTECALSDFTAIVSAIQAAGIPVMTVGDVLRHYDPEYKATLPVSLGGTGAASAAAARTNLGTLAAAGNLSDVASASASRVNLGALAANQLGPADHGLIAWSIPPYHIRGSDNTTTMAPGVLTVVKIPIPYATTITNIVYFLVAAGTSLTSGQNLAGLFSGTGNLLSPTGDQTVNFGNASLTKVAALTTPQPVAAGYVFAVFVFNGTGSAPALAKGDATTLANVNLSAANSLFATANTGVTTTLPSTLGTLTALGAAPFAAVS